MLGRRAVRTLCLAAALCGAAVPAGAISIQVDYTYDTTNFFGTGNPQGAAAGAQAQAALEAAADFYSVILTDSFSSIETPDPFHSTVSNGVMTWEWTMNFNHPTSNASTTLFDQTVAEDEFRIFAGARNLTGTTLAVSGPGGFGASATPTGLFSPSENNQISQITDDFFDAVTMRGEPNGFTRWGGTTTFDRVGTNWNYDHTTLPSAGESDLFSVAIHELGHTLGLGASDQWNSWVSGTFFIGPESFDAHDGLVPLDCDGSSCGHWAEGTMSEILGTNTPQEVALDPIISSGMRTRLTKLDAAALTDIGWDVAPITFQEADYDFDGDVDDQDLAHWETWFGINGNADADGDTDTDGADLLVWQQQYTGPTALFAPNSIPEPSSLCLTACSLAALGFLARRRLR